MKVTLLKSESKSEVDLNASIDASISDYAIGVLNRVARQNLKQGTKHTKGRSEVQGRAAKPFKQKGTGNARQGSRKGPHMRGGGISHGAKPDYHKLALNRSFKQTVLKKVLSKYIEAGNLGFIDLESDTKKLRSTLGEEKTLIVFNSERLNKVRAFRNMPKVTVLNINSLSALKTLSYGKIYFDLEAKEKVQEILK
jgi:large subunit ribosomal protein L4